VSRTASVASPVLDVDRLSVSLSTSSGEVQALRDISFGVGEGETVGLVGESGCGKSLTALSITGLLPTGSRVTGDIRLAGESIVGLPPKRRRKLGGREIGMVFQDPTASLNPVLSIGEQLSESARYHLGLSRRDALLLARDMIRKVGIPTARNVLSEYPHQLSGGMCQRVSIASALICEPRLLIADEPTTALDVTIQAQILELLRQSVSDSGASLLLITHDLGVVARTCDRVFVMYAGQVVESGPTRAVLSSPRHPYTAALLRSVPDPESDADLHTIPGSVPELHDMPDGCRFAARCQFAQAKCHLEPPLEILGPRESVRCWFPLTAPVEFGTPGPDGVRREGGR
jgi:peptide/nickel transport system ATP-binding protein